MGNIRFGHPVLHFSFPVDWLDMTTQCSRFGGHGGLASPSVPNPFEPMAGRWGQQHGTGQDSGMNGCHMSIQTSEGPCESTM
jgi:hypothetical protein